MEKEKKQTGAIKGVVRKYGDNSFDFTPFGKGEPVFEEQQKFKNGVSVAKTRGQNGKRVVRIPVDSDTPDIYDACVRKLDEVYPAPEPAKRKMRPTATILEGTGLRVVHERTTGEVQIDMKVKVSDIKKMQKELYNLFNQINLCLAINKTIFPRA